MLSILFGKNGWWINQKVASGGKSYIFILSITILMVFYIHKVIYYQKIMMICSLVCLSLSSIVYHKANKDGKEHAQRFDMGLLLLTFEQWMDDGKWCWKTTIRPSVRWSWEIAWKSRKQEFWIRVNWDIYWQDTLLIVSESSYAIFSELFTYGYFRQLYTLFSKWVICICVIRFKS